MISSFRDLTKSFVLQDLVDFLPIRRFVYPFASKEEKQIDTTCEHRECDLEMRNVRKNTNQEQKRLLHVLNVNKVKFTGYEEVLTVLFADNRSFLGKWRNEETEKEKERIFARFLDLLFII